CVYNVSRSLIHLLPTTPTLYSQSTAQKPQKDAAAPRSNGSGGSPSHPHTNRHACRAAQAAAYPAHAGGTICRWAFPREYAALTCVHQGWIHSLRRQALPLPVEPRQLYAALCPLL